MKIPRNILATHYFAFIMLVAIVVGACTTIGSVKPQDFGERLAAGYATTTALRDSATKLLDARKIGSDDHKQITDTLAAFRVGLDVARKLEKVDPTQADAKLTATRTGLSALTEYISSREKGK